MSNCETTTNKEMIVGKDEFQVESEIEMWVLGRENERTKVISVFFACHSQRGLSYLAANLFFLIGQANNLTECQQ